MRFLIVSALCFGWFAKANPVKAGWEVGLAARPLTLPAGVPLAGYVHAIRRRNLFSTNLPFATYFKPSVGALSPVRAKAAVLRSGKEKLLLVSLDIIGVTEQLRQAIEQSLSGKFLPENIVLSATHTHSGPGGATKHWLWEALLMDKFKPQLFHNLIEDVVWAASEAEKALQPADVFATEFDTEKLQINRRVLGDPVDRSARLLLFKSQSGNWLGAWINFAVHGTALHAENLFLSADVPGAIEREVAEELSSKNPAGAPTPIALFANGAEGDVSPAEQDVAGIESISKGFRDQMARHWKESFRSLKPGWVSRRSVIDLGRPALRLAPCMGSSSWYQRLLSKLSIPVGLFLPRKTQIAQVELDGILLASWPGEPTTQSAEELKKALAHTSREVWPMGVTNDYLAYFPNQTESKEDSFESCFSFFGEEGASRVTAGHRALASAP